MRTDDVVEFCHSSDVGALGGVVTCIMLVLEHLENPAAVSATTQRKYVCEACRDEAVNSMVVLVEFAV